MSNQTSSQPTTAIEAVKEAPTVPTPVFFFDGDFPVYIFSSSADFDLVEASGHNHYFVLASGKEKRIKTGADGKDKTEDFDVIKLWRVYSSVLGRAVVDATPALSGIKYGTSLSFTNRLPKIPFSLINKMDAFFREVDRLHHSESIVMLVFDTRFFDTDNPSDGWGAVVPKQKNTAAFCDYDPTSVVEELEPEVILVGSAHSHPGMSAYASGTDHKDQADWDGIHITYGWMSSKNGGATEYYVETQYAGYKWARTLDEIAEMAPRPTVPKEELEDWIGNVSKGTTIVHHGSHNGGGYYNPKATTTPGYQRATGSSGGTRATSSGIVLHRAVVKLPTGAPDPNTHTIVGVIDDGNATNVCQFCDTPVSVTDLETFRCLACFNFIVPASKLNDDIDFNAVRIELGRKSCDELDRKQADKPIVLWRTDGTFSEDFRITAKK